MVLHIYSQDKVKDLVNSLYVSGDGCGDIGQHLVSAQLRPG